MRTPRHTPRNTAARDLREMRRFQPDPFVEMLIHDENVVRKQIEAINEQYD